MTRAKRDFGTIRKRANGRWQAYYMGPDQAFHRAPSTFDAKVDAEVVIYRGAKHGYAPPDMAAYDREASERHWREMTALFAQTLA